jgi:hypothetical protein
MKRRLYKNEKNIKMLYIKMSIFRATKINDVELIYSLLRERYPKRQIEIEFNDNTKEYTLKLTKEEYIADPEVPIDVNIKIVYGDSVTGDTPLLLKKGNQVYIETIQSIFNEEKKVEYPGFKMFDKSIRLDKEYSLSDYKVWSDEGWVNIRKVIRHKCDKKIYRVLTHTGCVDVTEDHSLLDENKSVIKPHECNIDTMLLSNYPTEFNESDGFIKITKNKAFIYGFFYGDGSCCRYECPSGLKYSWALNNSDMDLLLHLKDLLEKEYFGYSATIYDTIKSSGVYKLTMNCQKGLVEEYRSQFYDSDKYKKIPTIILNSDNEIIQSFFEGYFAADGCRKDKDIIGCTRFDNKGQIGSAGLYYLMRKLGYNVSLNIRNDKEKMFRLTITKKKQRKISNGIKKVIVKGTDCTNNYVYDIETDIGRFQAGVGNIIVSNTDSIFCSVKFNRDDFEKNRLDTFKISEICGNKLTNEIFNRKPVEMEFEKVFQPFILLTKKRYIGKKFENMKDPFEMKNITSAGIALTRRDYCLMVKDCYSKVIDFIMENQLPKAIGIYKEFLDRIENYDVPVDQLIISAALAKSYSCSDCKIKSEWTNIRCLKCKTDIPRGNIIKDSCPQCNTKFICLHTFSLAHVNLASKMLQRKEEINVNDRIQYIYVERDTLKKKTTSKGDLAEEPKYAKEHNLKFNRVCYTEQLAKPLLSFFKVVLDSDTQEDLIDYTNDKMDNYGASKFKPSDFKLNDE